eukprot:TRINITY_DN32384_c0_g1_i1.p1 TRINITY_DN32384_c0_g1~~TRINITY_DN32384_c0_g1_i1.p1  ORF type:complete len:471 (-),score=75.58 TRINITY_DN32384_c0_g1_i1:60-1472(-)
MLVTDASTPDGVPRDPPYTDVALRLLRPVDPAISYLHWCVDWGYNHPLEEVEDMLNDFNMAPPVDVFLGAKQGFLCSEGWRPAASRSPGAGAAVEAASAGAQAEAEARRRPAPAAAPAANASAVDAVDAEVVLFSPRPFDVTSHWFQTSGTVGRLCTSGLLRCLQGGSNAATDAVDNEDKDAQDRALLNVIRSTFVLTSQAASARPRLIQVGPSGCATTAIAALFTSHGLRVAKSVVGIKPVHGLIRQAISEGRPPLYYMDTYDMITDAFDVLRGGIHFCKDIDGPGGIRCERVESGLLGQRLFDFRATLEALRDTYPNLRFLLNTRYVEDWLPKRVHNCWPHLANPLQDWHGWLRIYESCCAPRFGDTGNVSCWRGSAGAAVALPPQLPVKSFGYLACCEGLHAYKEAWRGMHNTVLSAIGSSRTVVFDIDRSDPYFLSDALGLGDRHDGAAWRRIHVSEWRRPERRRV